MAVVPTNSAYRAVSKYFEILRHTGYKDYSSVHNLLIYLFIEEFMNIFSGYITEEDINIIYKAIYCIADNCIIIPPELYNYTGIINSVSGKVRMTEDSNLRRGEKENLRSI